MAELPGVIASDDGAAATRVGSRSLIEVRFGGSGGQGVILMGVILAVAATRDHLYVVQTQSYGPEARGGYSRSDVIISKDAIEYPQLQGADLLVALSNEAARRYSATVRRSGVLVYDSGEIAEPSFAGASYGAPFTQTAKDVIGRVQTANVLALAVAVGLTGVVSQPSLELAVSGMVPAGSVDINCEAMRVGLSMVESLSAVGADS